MRDLMTRSMVNAGGSPAVAAEAVASCKDDGSIPSVSATLGMEPSEHRALAIIRLAGEQANEITALQTALDEMTTRCQAAEYTMVNGHYLFSPQQLSDYLDKVRAAWEASRIDGQ